MPILRQYYSDHFEIVGEVLKIRESALGGITRPFTQTFPMSGGVHDYTADAAYNPSAYPDTDSAPMSAALGDGVDVPFFHVLNRAEIASGGVTRTAGNRLRITHGGADTGNNYPLSNGSPGLIIRLPPAQLLTVQFTVSMGNFNSAERVAFGIARLSNNDSGQPAQHSDVRWDPSSPTAASEGLVIYANPYGATTTLDTFITSNVLTRTYKLDVQGPNIATYGSPSSGSTNPSTFIRGRSSPLTGGMSNLVLYLSLGTAAAPTSGYYAEIGNLTISGTRSLI